jgi:threonylcarbamoyladenosine tRNA methylthiotransferase MtaB
MENRKKSCLLYAWMQTEFSETSTIARNFFKMKVLIDFEEVADMYVINTCSVTRTQTWTTSHLAVKLNEKAFVAEVGLLCPIETRLAAVDGVDWFLVLRKKFKILDYINDLVKNYGRSTFLRNVELIM